MTVKGELSPLAIHAGAPAGRSARATRSGDVVRQPNARVEGLQRELIDEMAALHAL